MVVARRVHVYALYSVHTGLPVYGPKKNVELFNTREFQEFLEFHWNSGIGIVEQIINNRQQHIMISCINICIQTNKTEVHRGKGHHSFLKTVQA